MLKNTSSSYGTITKLFHWLISIMVICLIIVGFTMANMDPSEQKSQIVAIHKATGVIVLSLVCLRLVWRLINVEVLLPVDLPSWQKAAARLNHYLLYVCMFLMPISGISMSLFAGYDINVFNIFTIQAFDRNIAIATLFYKTHQITAFGLVGLITLHILAALFHHFIRKDNVLIRMIR